MRVSRRAVAFALLGTGAVLLVGPAVIHLFAHPSGEPRTGRSVAAGQDAPNRREFTVVAKDFRFSPARIEVSQDDLVKLTVRSEDVAYSITIDEYRIARRVPPGGTTSFEFRTDRPGTFSFYSNLTSDARHREARGELVVRPQ
jgi:heme/copper-type cytochrome/quinol oxidase subunit 2